MSKNVIKNVENYSWGGIAERTKDTYKELMKKIGAKEWFTLLALMLLLTDVIIFLNIPILRQILAFLCFTTIPGLLILHIFKLNKIEFLKKFVLSIGLSIAFLIFVGLLLNQLYLAIGISKPLSTPSLVISFTFILIILNFIAYKRNKDDFDLSDILNVEFDLKKDQFISPSFFPLVFPFLAIFGAYLMNTEGNNIILMAMLFLIPAYVVIIVYLKHRIPKITYPIAILSISIALLLMRGLTSYYLIGMDVHGEYYAFRVVVNYLHWSISNHHSVLTACLSTSLLPSIYWSLSGIDKIYVYKLLYQIICAFTPLVCYVLFKKYVNELYAFLASIFFMSQVPFIFGLQSALRTELALFFFALAMMVFFDDEIDELNKRIFFFVFMFAVIVSHYSTSYIFFIMIFTLWLVTVSMKKFFKSKYVMSATMVILFFAMIFLWYSQLTIGFDNLMNFGRNTFLNLGNMFVMELREQKVIQPLLGHMGGNYVEVLAERIKISVLWITFIVIFIGTVDSIKNYKTKKSNFDLEYLLLTFISGCLLASFLILPFVSKGYGAFRLYQQCLVFLALTFVIGGKAICRYARHPQFGLLLILIVVISQFFCSTYVVHQVLGVPYSEGLNRAGDKHGELYIYDQDVIGAKWLNEYGAENLNIHTDRGAFGLLLGYDVDKRPSVRRDFFKNNKTINKGYLYLRHENVVNGKIYPTAYRKGIKSITEYSHLFIEKSKIYNNGGSEVYG